MGKLGEKAEEVTEKPRSHREDHAAPRGPRGPVEGHAVSRRGHAASLLRNTSS